MKNKKVSVILIKYFYSKVMNEYFCRSTQEKIVGKIYFL